MTSDSASRVTRSSRSLRVAVAMFAGVLAVATVLRAQETPPAPEAAPPAVPAGEPVTESATPAEAGPGASKAAGAEDADAAGAQPPSASGPTNAQPAPARPVGPTPGRFEPTEKVRADFDVAFPIDI